MRTGKPLKKNPVDSSYDAIIIGSGMGALTTGALMAKEANKRVLILEKHYTAGGYTHSFSRPGYEWDVGVHYMGEISRKGGVGQILDYVTEGKLAWADMGDVYDQIVIDGDRYDFVKGRTNWRNKMVEYFPREASAIDAYLDELGKLRMASQLYFADKVLPRPLSATVGAGMRIPLRRMASRTVDEVLRSLTDNPRLRAVLAGQWGDYGLPPKQASWAIHAMVAQHYFRGAYYPSGGASQIAAMVEPVLERVGGRIATNAGVEEILIENGRAAGVRLENGQEILAPIVISNAGVPLTERMLPEGNKARRELADIRRGIPASSAHVSLYVGLKATAEELGLPRQNLWVYPGDDFDSQVAAFAKDPDAPLPVAFLSFPSARDPEFTKNHPGRATLEVLTMAEYDWVSKWEGTRWKKRGADYEAFKDNLKNKLLDVLFEQVPQVRPHVDIAELSTPLTTKHFAGHPRGEIYGLACTRDRFEENRLRPTTRLPGLYLTGADVCSPGVAGAAIGGLLTGISVLKKNLFSTVMNAPYSPNIVDGPPQGNVRLGSSALAEAAE